MTDLERDAAQVVESLRALCHASHFGGTPAPVVYAVLGELSLLGGRLGTALNNLGTALNRSLETFDVYDKARDPAESVRLAREHLLAASRIAETLTAEISAAQSAISQQGYTMPADTRTDNEIFNTPG